VAGTLLALCAACPRRSHVVALQPGDGAVAARMGTSAQWSAKLEAVVDVKLSTLLRSEAA